MNDTHNTNSNRSQPTDTNKRRKGKETLLECQCGRILAGWDDIKEPFLNELTKMYFLGCWCGAMMTAQVPAGTKRGTSADQLLAALTVSERHIPGCGSQDAELIFALGHVVATRHAVEVAEEDDISLGRLLTEYERGEWGDILPVDRGLNEPALRDGERIFSVYQVTRDLTFWVITEWDRSYTTVMLPEDY